jgi:hypothetical protein
LKLLRALFPIIFQLVILLLDYLPSLLTRKSGTSDPPSRQSTLEETYQNILSRQRHLIAALALYRAAPAGSHDAAAFSQIQRDLVDLNEVHNNRLIGEFQKETDSQNSKWDFAKVVRTILSVTMMLSLLRMVLA